MSDALQTASSRDGGSSVPAVRFRRRRFSLSYPAIRQHSEMDCGAACLATVSRYYGRRVDINRLRDLARVGREGAKLSNLKRAAEVLGFEAHPIECPLGHLGQQQLPAIVNWKGYHWIVVHHVGRNRIVVADPARGLLRLPREKFEKDFTGFCLFMTPQPAFFEQPDDPSPIGQAAGYLAPYKFRILEILLAGLMAQAMAVSIPLFSKFLLDDIIIQGHGKWLIGAVIAVTGAAFMQFLFIFVRQELAFSVAADADHGIVEQVYGRLMHLPLQFFFSRTTGDVTSRMEEQRKITTFLTQHSVEIFTDLAATVVYSAIMIWFSPPLAMVAIPFVLVHVLIARIAAPRLAVAHGEAFEKGADEQSHILETLRGLEIIKSSGAAPFTRWRFNDLYAARANVELRIAGYAAGIGVVTGAIAQAASVAVLFAGALMVLDGEMSIGVLVAFTMFAGALFEPANGLVAAVERIQDALGAVSRLDDIMCRETEIPPKNARDHFIRMPKPRGAIWFDRTIFRYHPDDASNVLQNMSLQIGRGETVAIVGRSGCGKSTVLKLLFGLQRPTGGRILIDGFDLADLWLPSYRRHVGCVPQQPAIFAGTVRENVAFARPQADPQAIKEALRLAEAAEFVSQMPGGIDAVLDEKGANLSGGQRQRLAIARVFLQFPAILLLDEATSALDYRTEARVMENLEERFKGRTILMVAHRLSTVRRADRIVVLNRGLIAEQGTHEELMAAKGLYRRLVAQES